ncbi:MAG: hypothetical protein ACK5WX_01430, partial [bacterium]
MSDPKNDPSAASGPSTSAGGASAHDSPEPARQDDAASDAAASEEADPRLGRWRVGFPTISVVFGMIGIGVHVGVAAQMLCPEGRERRVGGG